MVQVSGSVPVSSDVPGVCWSWRWMSMNLWLFDFQRRFNEALELHFLKKVARWSWNWTGELPNLLVGACVPFLGTHSGECDHSSVLGSLLIHKRALTKRCICEDLKKARHDPKRHRNSPTKKGRGRKSAGVVFDSMKKVQDEIWSTYTEMSEMFFHLVRSRNDRDHNF